MTYYLLIRLTYIYSVDKTTKLITNQCHIYSLKDQDFSHTYPVIIAFIQPSIPIDFDLNFIYSFILKFKNLQNSLPAVAAPLYAVP